MSGNELLLERYLPEFQFRNKHSTVIRAPSARVYRAMESLNLSRSLPVRILLRLRGLPTSGSTWENFRRLRFCELGRIPEREFALGVVGQFWTWKGRLQRLDAQGFLNFAQEGYAKAIWHFGLEPAGEGRSVLHTETRIQCLGDKAYRKFRRYWNFIAPFSGFIRKRSLEIVRCDAEAAEGNP
ncbi:MAG TPA: hypothetical protein VJR29_02545 [bacterium]|nr:hypothetical protein [bacterium]